MTAGDVLTYVSSLVDDEDPSNDELAKDLAEQINEKQMIAAGLVPPSGILYRSGNLKRDRESDESLPEEFALEQNYPNPFNPSTTIKYSIPKEGYVTIKIYNTIGEEVAILVNEVKQVGNYESQFNATSLPSGIYFYKLQAGSFVETKKMVLMK
jgi:hypothetical protein